MPPNRSLPSAFAIENGWPARLPGTRVAAFETGVTLGGLILTGSTWAALRACSPLSSIRIDDSTEHPPMASPPPSEEQLQAIDAIPREPVEVPVKALGSEDAFRDWVWATHGALGRLMVWDDAHDWWLLHEPDFELLLLCARPSMLLPVETAVRREESWVPVFEWLTNSLTLVGRSTIERIATSYEIDLPAGWVTDVC